LGGIRSRNGRARERTLTPAYVSTTTFDAAVAPRAAWLSS
jgi:hypothetical protein